MKNEKKLNYFLSLDVGTNSVGYATSTPDYKLIKYRQHPACGVHLFESASTAIARRTFRVGRRRLDRRQQRIQLLRELFAVEIAKVDAKFFSRIDNSSYQKESYEKKFAIFADDNYSDQDFYKKYPTIHHLICELMESEQPHDVRLVYVACAWLLAHRGHFFSEVDKEKISEIVNFSSVYSELECTVENMDAVFPWKNKGLDISLVGDILKSDYSRSDKSKKIIEYLQIKKQTEEVEALPFDPTEFIRMLCGLEGKMRSLFKNEDYDEKLSLDSDDEKIAEILTSLKEEDASVIVAMKKVFDWSVLADILGEETKLSKAKVKVFEKHKSDLKNLKKIVKKYLYDEEYREIFRSSQVDNYTAYCGNWKKISAKTKKTDREKFYKYIDKKLKQISNAEPDDQILLEQIKQDMLSGKFLPKQVVSDNRTIPYQLYYDELRTLLKKASVYLPFLSNCDKDNLSVAEKILSIMEFRVPYFVGPLNASSKFAWFKRKAAGRILPWNFEQKIDLEASEEVFINRMLNNCTYLPGESVLPKQSLLYQKFEVLNLINNIQICGQHITPECKQGIYNLFYKYNKISKKKIIEILSANNVCHGITPENISGIDDVIPVSLDSWKLFNPLIESQKLTIEQAEQIIHKGTFTEDKIRFKLFLKKFPALDEQDIKKIAAKKFQGFGRLSRKFLTGISAPDPVTGEMFSVINMMWMYNLNLQQLLSDKYQFSKIVEKIRKEYYSDKALSLTERLDDMYISNAVKRPIIRTMTIINEVVKSLGNAPAKIFVEMARDVSGSNEKKRTVSRKTMLEEIYKTLGKEVRELNEELEKYSEGDLQKNTLFLYFTQLGRDMYSGEPITDLSLYNKEHIYPRSKVKDDSILNNIVLVKSDINGEKKDTYPIAPDIRQKMMPFWKSLLDKKLISAEKYFRLTRATPFSNDEKWGFINRQLVETRQSTKVITELLKEYYPDTEIIYVKSGLVSDFRNEFGIVKSRSVNDLHHAKDAYLNIVVGNVYHSYFTKNWFLQNSDDYSINTKTLFKSCLNGIDGTTLWRGWEDIGLVKSILKKNYLHYSCYSFCKHGGLFDQNPLPMELNLIPLKKDKPTEFYGGYRKPTATFFVLALTEEMPKKKRELTLVPVDLMFADKFLADYEFAVDYIKNFIDPSGKKSYSVQFPLGQKPIKINSVFEVDNGLRFRLKGKSNGGHTLLIAIFTPLLLDVKSEEYIKHLEAFCEKKRKNPGITYSLKYDKFSSDENVELFDRLVEKLKNGIFSKRPANPVDELEKIRDKFIQLEPPAQADLLLSIIGSFGNNSGAGINLKCVEGKGSVAVTTLSGNLSNWKKNFSSVRIVYSDASGLHEIKSVNLLDLI